VQVAELADVPLQTAFLWNGSVFIREGRELPAANRAWFRAPDCATAGTFVIVADWLGVTGPKKPRFDGDLRTPYRLEVRVTHGPSTYRFKACRYGSPAVAGRSPDLSRRTAEVLQATNLQISRSRHCRFA
jgi:hypothetical protein